MYTCVYIYIYTHYITNELGPPRPKLEPQITSLGTKLYLNNIN